MQASSILLDAFAWPGGYAINYIDVSNCDYLCATCANNEFETDPFVLFAPDIYWEGPDIYCDSCNVVIESEYGDPDE